MAFCKDKWFEIRYDDLEQPYLLIVRPDEKKPGYIIVIDPQEKYKIAYHSESYGDVCQWLGEDEYERIEGRVYIDDGWPPFEEFKDDTK